MKKGISNFAIFLIMFALTAAGDASGEDFSSGDLSDLDGSFVDMDSEVSEQEMRSRIELLSAHLRCPFFLTFGGKRGIDEMVAPLGSLDGKRVLDYGCGTGGPVMYLAETFDAEVVGADINPILLDMAQTHAKAKGVFETTAFVWVTGPQAAPINDAVFDVVLIKEMLPMNKNISDILRGAYRVLKNGGQLLIVDKCLCEDKNRTLVHDFYGMKSEIVYFFTLNELQDALKKARFTIVETSDLTSTRLEDIKTETREVMDGTCERALGEEFTFEDRDEWLKDCLFHYYLMSAGLTKLVCIRAQK